MIEPDAFISPSPGLWAVVRHADPPELAPEDLLAYLVPVYAGDRLADWELTDDVIAFAGVDVPTAYQRWRSTWERSWPLDSHSSLARLTEVARALAGPLALTNQHLLNLATADAPQARVITEADELLQLAAELERVRDAIRERESTGFGFVDATEGRERVGLATAWSSSGGSEIIASDRFIEVSMHPGTGLCVEVAGPPLRSIEGVREVALLGSGVDVTTDEQTVRLGTGESTALTWVVPGAAHWRVRTVPEVLVWARTFGGLAESCRYAAALHRPVVVSDRPSASFLSGV